MVYSETKVFRTKERCPYLIWFETVSKEDVNKLEPEYERDFDYLRWQCKLVSPDIEELVDIKEKKKSEPKPKEKEKEKENDKFESLRQMLVKENRKAQKSQKKEKKMKQRSKSLLLKSNTRIWKKKKSKTSNAVESTYDIKNLNKMPEKEIISRMNFLLKLFKLSKTKGFNKRKKEYLAKLKNTFSALKIKKKQKKVEKKSHEQIRLESPYYKFPSYKLRGYIVKSGDDMRQESLIIHYINSIKRILERENCPVFLKDLDLITISKNSALIEFVPNSQSIDSLKKTYKRKSLYEIFKLMFVHNFEETQKNFVESLAGYCFACYVLQIRDRHNSNILIDNLGHIIHIDFGFCFNSSPGNINFETAPFKFTADYLEIIGGFDSPMFHYFKILLYKAFDVFKKHAEEFWGLVEIMISAELECFKKFDIKLFKSRFHRFCSDQERVGLIEELIEDSFGSRRTALYDKFQKFSNGIEI